MRGKDDLFAMGEAQRLEDQLDGMLSCDWPTLACYRSRLLLHGWLHTEAWAVQQGRSFPELLARYPSIQ
jgi:hypothetical protein